MNIYEVNIPLTGTLTHQEIAAYDEESAIESSLELLLQYAYDNPQEFMKHYTANATAQKTGKVDEKEDLISEH